MKKNKSSNFSDCIPIVGDGAIATIDTGEGRLIPVVILDCENHKEFLNLINIHQHTPPGDARSTWGYKRFNRRFVFLILEFSKPSEIEISIRFDLLKQPALADGIVQARGVYLQPSKYGRRVLDGLASPKIMVEIPSLTKLNNWDELLIKQLTKKLKKKGLSKKEATLVAKEHLIRMREMWGRRMRNV